MDDIMKSKYARDGTTVRDCRDVGRARTGAVWGAS